MNPASLILIIAGAGSLAQGFMDLPKVSTPLHHLRRERFHGRRREQAFTLIAVGVVLLLLAVAAGDWR